MNVDVKGKNGFVVSEAIKTYANEKIAKIERFFTDELFATVVCKVYKDHHKVEVTVPTKFMTMRAEVSHTDMYAALDSAVDKLEAQIRKNKARITRSLQHKKGANEFFTEEFDLEALQRELVAPVKCKTIEIEDMSVEQALTHMDMLDHSFYIYKDIETQRVCVVYLREDGDYALIETIQ